jgi:hypothetical protein
LQKIVKIFILLAVCGGCTVMKKGADEKKSVPGHVAGLNFYEKVLMNNISNKSFYISRANIVFERAGNAISGFANIKFKFPDKYLVSIRSFGGFEIVRVFLSSDTLLINDRINRKLMYGEPAYLKKKFGIEPSMISVIFGDFYYNENAGIDAVDCDKGLNKSTFKIGKYNGLFTFDCEKKKVVATSLESAKIKSYLLFNYKDFDESGSIIYPTSISVEQEDEAIRILIEIKSIEYDWEGEIDFIPGIKYEKVELI